MKTILLAALLLMVTACGQAQGNPTSPSSTSSQPLLFAALEANGTANAWTYNTVVIAGLDGYAKAKTTFAPMPVPDLGCMGAILPQSAHVAAGKVFFADGKGVVRSLAIDGNVATVATFPLTSTQQMLSFAVSADGSKLLATVFTAPKKAFSCTDSSSLGTFTFDVYSASSGGTNHLLSHESWTKAQNVLALTGWDAVGPVGTYPTVWASQGGGPASTLGVYVRIDATTGKPLGQLADPSKCQVWNSVQSGAFVCLGDAVITGGGTADQKVSQPVSVRTADGAELWHYTVTGQNGPFGPLLAPDGQHVMICCNDRDLAATHELLIGRDGSQADLAKGFIATGWLDATTAIGSLSLNPQQQPPLPIAYVSSKTPGTAVPMGFTGAFVGTVRG